MGGGLSFMAAVSSDVDIPQEACRVPAVCGLAPRLVGLVGDVGAPSLLSRRSLSSAAIWSCRGLTLLTAPGLHQDQLLLLFKGEEFALEDIQGLESNRQQTLTDRQLMVYPRLIGAETELNDGVFQFTNPTLSALPANPSPGCILGHRTR